MNKLLQQIERIERLDQMIRLKATGTPRQLAYTLGISKTSLHRLIDTMKELGAPIEFNIVHQSYIYTNDVDFLCGFYIRELSKKEIKHVNGGFAHLSQLVNF